MTRLEKVLWEMHKIVNPGEYGLGSEPGSYPNDKEAWVQLGKLLDKAIDIIDNEGDE